MTDILRIQSLTKSYPSPEKKLTVLKDLNFNLEIKESSRNMFLSGEWDATATLLENETLVEGKSKELPYIKFDYDF